jgi:hypothetical protein
MAAPMAAGALTQAIGGTVKGLTGIASGIIGSGKRKREEAAAQEEYDMFKNQYAELDTSNLYANLENTMEDLTVDQRAAEFQLQAQQQGQANIMDQMAGAAGGSGIAALAQAMANQQTQGAAQAAASIGQQERSNQMAQAQMAGSLQMAEASGAETARGLEYKKTGTQLGMAQERLGAAKAARAQATQAIMGGIGEMAGAAAPGIGAAIGGDAGGFMGAYK